MGFLLLILLTIVLISSYRYITVVYECLRKVKIKEVKTLTGKNPLKLKHKSLKESQLETVEEESVKAYQQAPGPLPWPILGNLALLGRYAAPFQGFSELAKQFGPIYALTLGSTRCLVVNNLDLIREVLNQKGKYFGGRPEFLRFNLLFGGNRNNSLALCDWSQLQEKRRNLARKHCSPRNASTFYEKMSEMGCLELQEFFELLNKRVGSEGRELALKPFIQQLCANMFCQYMCTKHFDYDDNEFQLIVRCFDEIFWEINQGYAVDFLPWLYPFYKNHMEKIAHWSATIRNFILSRIINERESNISDEAIEKDFTDALLKSLNEHEHVSRDTIIYMLEDFIGGHSAVGNLVMLALAFIVKNPQVGQQIQAETDEIVQGGSQFITLKEIDSMPFTMATLFEVLRYCSSPIVPHVATVDVVVGGYGVTKGTIVFINNYILNTSPSYWSEPEKFQPERFLTTLSSPKIDPVTNKSHKIELTKKIPHFLPFSVGKRTCIGQNLVKSFAFLILANILHKYDVSSRDVTKIKTYIACVAVPPDTFLLTLKPRAALQTSTAPLPQL